MRMVQEILSFTTLFIILAGVTVEGTRRFIFDSPFYNCTRCYECYCKLSDCPFYNPLQWVGAYSGCVDLLKDLDCSVPFKQHGQWSDWGTWSACRGSCDYPNRYRTRNCTNPEPKNCGKTCEGRPTEFDTTCKPNLCSFLHNIGQSFGITSAKPTASVLPTLMTTLNTQKPQLVTPMNTSQSTSQSPDTTSSMISTTFATTTAFQVKTTCAKLCAISAVANKEHQSSDGATTCSDGKNASSEALPMSCCGLSTPTNWRPGPVVMLQCGLIPQYIPVASYKDGQIVPGSEGIFIDCLQPPEVGFQIIRQECTTAPSIVHIDSSQTVFPNPFSYHIVS